MLRLSRINKRFASAIVLDGVDFEVAAGSVHALLGENGAGKTTLMRIAYGMLAPDSGRISIDRDGTALSFDRIESPRAARALGIGMVHQHFASIDALTVADNIALAAGWRGGDHAARARELIERLGFHLDPTARARDLTVQLRQRLEILQALATDARILLLDEPTAVLAPSEIAELLERIRDFARGGGAVVLITHKLDEAMRVADRVTVLRRGQVTASGSMGETTPAELSRAMIGSSIPLQSTLERKVNPTGEIRVRVANIELRAGEVVGIAAIEGNGQRELLRAIAGFGDADVTTFGRSSLVPEDRIGSALLPDRTLADNHLLGNLDRAGAWLDRDRVRRDTADSMARHDVRAAGVDALARELSGGNQQKFVLGRTLDRQPQVIVAENPSRGLDFAAARAVHLGLREAAASGSCVVVHSADLDELLAISDRILVVHRGNVRELPIDTPREIIGDAMLGIAAR